MMPADEAIQRLKEGNQRYAAGQSVNAITDVETRRSLIGSQRPFVAVLGCADSRAIPELIFDAGIGELFVVRVAGNVINPQNNGSLEYAVEHLDVSLIVVLGHQPERPTLRSRKRPATSTPSVVPPTCKTPHYWWIRHRSRS